jgi:hypothetical protein
VSAGIEPGSSSRVAVRFITAAEHAEFRRSLKVLDLGMSLYPAFASFEDGSSWLGISPPPSSPLTIPRVLISSTSPKPTFGATSVWTCYDAEAHQTSEGGVAAIREDPSHFVKCSNGRWVETKVP